MKKVNELLNGLNETENLIDLNSNILYESFKNDELDEGILGSIIGGAAGFLIGPIIGKAMCKILGVTQGLLYNLLTSKVVTTAIGMAVANSKNEPPKPATVPPIVKK